MCQSLPDEAREALDRRLEELRRDPEFQARLRRTLEEHREVLRALART
jgi:hypothetical protein